MQFVNDKSLCWYWFDNDNDMRLSIENINAKNTI